MLRDIRKQYESAALIEAEVAKNPFVQFENWLQNAVQSAELEPTAMVLSTVDENLQPHSRVVLLKDFSVNGLVFYSNYEGHKAKQMEGNKRVSVLFHWQTLEQQVRITGVVEKLSEEISTDYFHSRPLDSQLGAWTSPQSQIIPDAAFLIERFKFYQQQFGELVPKPPHWGGFAIKPKSFEFWQGRPNRLHDRLIFKSNDLGKWTLNRLAP